MVNEPLVLETERRADLDARRLASPWPELWRILDAVHDPEIPALGIFDLGILQNVVQEGEAITVTITPTWSGCPAMAVIAEDIERALAAAGYSQVRVVTRSAPAWSSDWLNARARAALRESGIAPPDDPACPQCGSHDLERIAEYGSTACKALYRCRACREPFAYFKPI